MKKKLISIVVLLVLCSSIFAQEKLNEPKEITGKTSYFTKTLKNVNIIVKGTNIGAKSDIDGSYSIIAKTGDVIQYSFVGYKTINIIIEDVTNILNVQMFKDINQLDEVLVKAKTKTEAIPNHLRVDKLKKFSTARGTIDPIKSGYSVGFIDGKDINLTGAPSLSLAIAGKFPGVRIEIVPNKWGIPEAMFYVRGSDHHMVYDIDGLIYDEDPSAFIRMDDIKSVYVLKSFNGLSRYGVIGSNGVIVIQTKSAYLASLKNENKNNAEKYLNKNYYNNDAVAYATINNSLTAFTKKIKGINNKELAFEYYTKNFTLINNYSDHVSVAELFYNYYSDKDISKRILHKIAETHNNNPEILKVIGYQMQVMNAKVEAINIYKKVFKLRPNYAQSYRDLANAYKDNDNYNKAWRMYMGYLIQGNNISDNAIGELIFNEMEWLYYNRNNQSDINMSFYPKNESIVEFRDDTRIVFEWNTSEAEFELEFVNPNNQAYVYKHSLANDEQTINNGKELGYSSKEFMIQEIGLGNWMVNINYLGNKKPESTYIKVTLYNKWGSPNQTQEVSVFKFKDERKKIQLYNLNNNSYISFNN